MNFSELSHSAPLKSNLAKHGFAQPTPVQAQSIPPALAGRDLVATAQTGTGKTLAFVLPVIHRLGGSRRPPGSAGGHPQPHTRTGTANPRDLRKDGLVRLFAPPLPWAGSTSEGNCSRSEKARKCSSPRKAIRFPRPQTHRSARRFQLVLDEADRMLDMGFLPTIRKIMAAMPPDR